MDKLSIKIEHKLISQSTPSKHPSVFNRVLRYLIKEGKEPGLIKVLILKHKSNFKVVGVFTINQRGSVSFFPDFSDLLQSTYSHDGLSTDAEHLPLLNYDHLTIMRDLVKGSGHVTRVIQDKRRHHDKLNAINLKSRLYHWFTITMNNPSMLNDLFQPIKFPEIEIKDKAQEEYLQMLNTSLTTGDLLFVTEFPSEVTEDEIGCIQIQLIPKDQDIHNRPPPPFTELLREPRYKASQIPRDITVKWSTIDTFKRSDFNIKLIFFNVKTKPHSSLVLIRQCHIPGMKEIAT